MTPFCISIRPALKLKWRACRESIPARREKKKKKRKKGRAFDALASRTPSRRRIDVTPLTLVRIIAAVMPAKKKKRDFCLFCVQWDNVNACRRHSAGIGSPSHRRSAKRHCTRPLDPRMNDKGALKKINQSIENHPQSHFESRSHLPPVLL